MKDGWTHVDNKESACFCLKCIFMAYGLQCELYQQITVGMKHDGIHSNTSSLFLSLVLLPHDV